MTKYLQLNETDGEVYEKSTVETSDGAADADEIPALNPDGVLDPSLLNAATSGAEVVVMTLPSGRLDQSIMPVGIGVDAVNIEASEALSANDTVNIHFVTGAARVRRADASNGRTAHGYVTQSCLVGEQVLVYREGTNAGVAGLTGPKVYLGAAPGSSVSTPPVGDGVIQQLIGTAHAADAYYFSASRPVHLIA